MPLPLIRRVGAFIALAGPDLQFEYCEQPGGATMTLWYERPAPGGEAEMVDALARANHAKAALDILHCNALHPIADAL